MTEFQHMQLESLVCEGPKICTRDCAQRSRSPLSRSLISMECWLNRRQRLSIWGHDEARDHRTKMLPIDKVRRRSSRCKKVPASQACHDCFEETLGLSKVRWAIDLGLAKACYDHCDKTFVACRRRFSTLSQSTLCRGSRCAYCYVMHRWRVFQSHLHALVRLARSWFFGYHLRAACVQCPNQC